MTVNLIKLPNFRRSQRVSFVGGEGIVRSHKHEGGSWHYVVEMELGTKPNFGRIGAETMVLLNETDLRAVQSSRSAR